MLRLGSEREQLGVVADQVGTPTYAGDLAKVILDILRMTATDSKKFVTGIYHYSNEGAATWYDFTKAIFEYTPGIKCEVNPIDTAAYPTPAIRPAYSVLNKSKIKSTFGIKIPFWRDSLKLCLIKLQEDAKK
jgi:dTDP-4-dehydrorhamnose reductase